MPDLLKPAMYQSTGTAADPAHPALLGGACTCGYVYFPMQAFGCERCGRTDVAPRALSGRGKLLASTRVHLHNGKHRQAPFTVGSVALDDGPIVRTILIDDDKPFHPGDMMVTTLVAVSDAEGAAKQDLRFARAG